MTDFEHRLERRDTTYGRFRSNPSSIFGHRPAINGIIWTLTPKLQESGQYIVETTIDNSKSGGDGVTRVFRGATEYADRFEALYVAFRKLIAFGMSHEFLYFTRDKDNRIASASFVTRQPVTTTDEAVRRFYGSF